jgi:hypothetical protein
MVRTCLCNKQFLVNLSQPFPHTHMQEFVVGMFVQGSLYTPGRVLFLGFMYHYMWHLKYHSSTLQRTPLCPNYLASMNEYEVLTLSDKLIDGLRNWKRVDTSIYVKSVLGDRVEYKSVWEGGITLCLLRLSRLGTVCQWAVRDLSSCCHGWPDDAIGCVGH